MNHKHRRQLRAYCASLIETALGEDRFRDLAEEILGHAPSDLELQSFRQCAQAMADKIRHA